MGFFEPHGRYGGRDRAAALNAKPRSGWACRNPVLLEGKNGPLRLPAKAGAQDRLRANGVRHDWFSHPRRHQSSEERRVGKECVRKVRSRWWQSPYKKNKKQKQPIK